MLHVHHLQSPYTTYLEVTLKTRLVDLLIVLHEKAHIVTHENYFMHLNRRRSNLINMIQTFRN